MMIEPQQLKVGDLVEERSAHGYTARYIVIRAKEYPETKKLVYTLYTLWVDSPGRFEQQKPGAIDYLTSGELTEGKSVKWKIL
jgi:hypothetical protein